ncbi:MAG TPA: MgtC/SapB family protein [Gemmatimonadales bacterium]|nr:MgtC/SapB family protein [Gemmatimonadales bacterium]
MRSNLLLMEIEPRLELVLLIRLLVAGMLSAVLGWEREAAHKPAGLRTHMLVGIASALYTVLAELAVLQHPGDQNDMRADPIRAIQAVAIGVGFLGSGVIFVSRSEDTVLGLTTAGSIWATAAIGISAGLGYYILAVGATLLLMIVLRGMARFDRD